MHMYECCLSLSLTHTHMYRRLSIEVDQLLSELPSDYPPMSDNPVKTNTERLHKLHTEERTLQNQVNRLRNHRERLATELQGLITQVGNVLWIH